MSDRLSSLTTDLAADILTNLPIPSLLRAAAVSKHLRSVITSPTFPTHPNHLSLPWFFLHGLHNTNPKLNQSFAFDPSSSLWLRLPPPSPSSSDFLGSSGFLFSTAPSFSFSPVLKPLWKFTSPLTFSRINPLLGVFTCSGCAAPRFVVVGGVRFIGGLVDIEDRLAVEIYDSVSDSWEICSPLPPDFPSGNSCQTLSSALFGGRFYVFGIFSFFVSWFDLRARVWSRVSTVRPPGLVFGFLVSSNEMLVLAGMCNGANGPSFNLWRVDCESLELREMGAMPRELLYGLVDVEEEDKFASLKCVGTGGLVYVFNEEYHKKYPACVCEIDGTSGECRWRRVPPLPSPVNKFHKVVSFCSTVLPRDVFVGEEGEGGVVRGVED